MQPPSKLPSVDDGFQAHLRALQAQKAAEDTYIDTGAGGNPGRQDPDAPPVWAAAADADGVVRRGAEAAEGGAAEVGETDHSSGDNEGPFALQRNSLRETLGGMFGGGGDGGGATSAPGEARGNDSSSRGTVNRRNSLSPPPPSSVAFTVSAPAGRPPEKSE